MSSYLERRIATLERMVYPMSLDTAKLRTQLGHVNQKIQGIRAGGFPCLTIIQRRVKGCNPVTLQLPGASVQLIGNVTLTDYGTWITVADGTFEASIDGLFAATEGSQLRAIVTGPGSRFVTASPQFIVYTQCATSTSATDLTATPATGYACHQAFDFPLATTLTVDDSFYGSGLVSTHSGGQWNTPNPGPTYATPGGGALGCPASASTFEYNFAASLGDPTLTVRFQKQPAGFCPYNGPGWVSGLAAIPLAYATITTPPGVTDKLDMIWTIPAGSPTANVLYGGSGATIRIREP